MEEREVSAKHLIAGGAARCTSAALLMPIDTVKTRLQFQGNLSYVTRYNNFVDAFHSIYKNEGIASFYRGLPTKLMYKGPAGAVSFGCYELIRHLIRDPKEVLQYKKAAASNPLVLMAVGTTARIIGTAARTPFDIVKQQQQVHGAFKGSQRKSGAFGVAKDVMAKEGFGGLFKGFTVSLVRDMPFGTLYFVTYEIGKVTGEKLVGRSNKYIGKDTLVHAVSGGAAGLVATVATCPFDVIKTRLQTQFTLRPEDRRYKSMIQTFLIIYKEEGLNGLMSGIAPRLMYLIPAGSITFTAFELYKKMLDIQ